MKTRAEIKSIALSNFKANYWPVVGITVVYGLIVAALSMIGLGFLIIPAITVGFTFFYIAVFFGDKENSTFEQMFNVGFAKFGRNLGSILLEGLLIYAWSLLLIVPGIIKAYSYAMTQYILADCPDVKAVDAITISRRMMKGHKWEFFVFQLSFLGWFILSGLTLGILSIFYVDPYYYASVAGYYVELKKLCIETGVVTADQFAGAPLDENVATANYEETTYAEPSYAEPVYAEPVYTDDSVVEAEAVVVDAVEDVTSADDDSRFAPKDDIQ